MSSIPLRFCRIKVFSLLLMLASLTANAQIGVKINEVFANNNSVVYQNGVISDWIELFNTTAGELDLSDASLSDSPTNPRRWIFPGGVKIPANGFLVVLLDGSEPFSIFNDVTLNAGFGLKATGDQVYLFGKGVNGALLDSVSFGIQAADLTIGRVPDGGNWTLTTPTPGGANTAQQQGAVTGLRINEWLASESKGTDWIELYNSGTLPVALSGLYLTDDLNNKTLSPLAPLSFIGTGRDAFALYYADAATNKSDHVGFKLSASGETIGLFGPRFLQIDVVTFGQQTIDVSQGRLPDGTANVVSFQGKSVSPGEANFVLLQNIVVNELLSHAHSPLEDAVEFYNTTGADINIGGWYLSNSQSDFKKYRVPDNSIIPANGYIVFYEYQFGDTNSPTRFTFNAAHGDDVYLSQAVNGQLTGYRVGQKFDSAENGVSFGRVVTSTGEAKFVAMSRRTFGADDPLTVEEFRTGKGLPNAKPKLGPLVINEIMYKPVSPDGVTDNTLDEYVEIYNVTGSPVPLYDPLHQTNSWHLRGGVTFDFPRAAIPAFGYALVVSFDPADATQAAAFRSKYSVPSTVQLFGPYAGKLGNAGDEIDLKKPDPPQTFPHADEGYVPYIRVDRVTYSDATPWPAGADGTGKSLQKKNFGLFGDDPVSWDVALPTAGRANFPALPDTDGDGIPDDWEGLYHLNPNDPTDASLDPDQDGFSNLAEFIAGTNPFDANSLLKIDQLLVNQGANKDTIIKFTAQAGKSYSVQFRSSLSPVMPWQSVVDLPAQTATGQIQVTDRQAFGKTERYYRVITPAAN